MTEIYEDGTYLENKLLLSLGYQLARRRRTITLGTLDHFRHL